MRAGSERASNIARWDGQRWHALEGGVDDEVFALAEFEGRLYVGGVVGLANGQPTGSIARWDGAWSTVGEEGDDGAVHALAVFDDGTGDALYAAGSFSRIGGVDANRIAKFDGSSWSAIETLGGNGVSALQVQSLLVHDDGAGEALFVLGRINGAGGIAVRNIARWDGASWSNVGGGLGDPFLYDNFAEAAVVFDGGSGPALYVGGRFDVAGGVPVRNVARWDGAAWSDVSGRFARTNIRDAGLRRRLG